MPIRKAKTEDIPQILLIYSEYVLHTNFTFEYTVPSEKEFTERFNRITARYPWLVWDVDGEIRGYAYGSEAFSRKAYQWTADVTIYMHPDAKRQGGATLLYKPLLEIMRLQGLKVAYAIITATNKSSIAFHRSLGFKDFATFRRTGYKAGEWLDVVWMEYELSPISDHPSEPIPFHLIDENALLTILRRYNTM